MRSSILLIYTGGTIGMMEDPSGRMLVPLDFTHLEDHVPELKRFSFKTNVISFENPLDSSDVDISTWQKLSGLISEHYDEYDGFVILHGTDTMAYTASALSFMLENLSKPVILTGSQLPIGKLRTDGKENLIAACEIAGAVRDGKPVVQEVAVYFESRLFRGNRVHKYNTENFAAFESANFPPLAEVGIHIFYNHAQLLRPFPGVMRLHREMENNIAILKIFPGISETMMKCILENSSLKGLVMESYGSGNAPRDKWFIDILYSAIKRGIPVVNVSQCNKGFVEQGRYATSDELRKIGVISGADMTTECAVTKLMFLLGCGYDHEMIAVNMATSLRGELTAYSSLERS